MGFYQKIDLKLHMLTHSSTMNKLHECNICKRRFKQASHLKYHLHSHLKQVSDVAQETASSETNEISHKTDDECKQEDKDDDGDDDDDDDDDDESAGGTTDDEDDGDSVSYSSSPDMSLEQMSEFI